MTFICSLIDMNSASRKPPIEPFADGGKSCHRDGDWLWLPLRNRWSEVSHKPEEIVRQEWIRRLVIEGGFELEQMDQEVRSLAHGHGSPLPVKLM